MVTLEEVQDCGLCLLLSVCCWFVLLTFSTFRLLSGLSVAVFVSHPASPTPLFALPLCPPTAQMISALSSHPVDFCGLHTPPYFVPTIHTHTHTFCPHLSEYFSALLFSSFFILYVSSPTCLVCIYRKKKSIISDTTNYFPPPTTHLCHMTSSYWSLWATR